MCSGNPLFVRDTSLGGSLSVRGSKCVGLVVGARSVPCCLHTPADARHSLRCTPRWVAASNTVEGVSLFDVKGAVKLMEGSRSELPKQWVPKPSPEPVLQLGRLNFRLMPELTRALGTWMPGGDIVAT